MPSKASIGGLAFCVAQRFKHSFLEYVAHWMSVRSLPVDIYRVEMR